MSGLAAGGMAGDWEILLDELAMQNGGRGQPQWGLTVANRTVHIQILVPNANIISKVLEFLNTAEGELSIGSWSGADALLLKEEGRLQLKVLRRANLKGADFTELIVLGLTGRNLELFVEALEDLLRNLKGK